jgi:hypothetical protein
MWNKFVSELCRIIFGEVNDEHVLKVLIEEHESFKKLNILHVFLFCSSTFMIDFNIPVIKKSFKWFTLIYCGQTFFKQKEWQTF